MYLVYYIQMTWIPVDRDSLKSSEMYILMGKLWRLRFQNGWKKFDLKDSRSMTVQIKVAKYLKILSIWFHTQAFQTTYNEQKINSNIVPFFGDWTKMKICSEI